MTQSAIGTHQSAREDAARTFTKEAGMYALVLQEGDFEFLIDPRDLWSVPRVVVRSGWREAEVWLDEEGVSFRKPGKFAQRDEQRILLLVDEHLDELLDSWFSLREDLRRDRLDRNTLVD